MTKSPDQDSVTGPEAAARAAAEAMRTGKIATPPGTSDPHHLPGALAGWVPTPRRRLGDIVVDAMWVPRHVVEELVVEAREIGRPIGQLLLDRGMVTSEQLGQAIAERFGLPYLPLRQPRSNLRLRR